MQILWMENDHLITDEKIMCLFDNTYSLSSLYNFILSFIYFSYSMFCFDISFVGLRNN